MLSLILDWLDDKNAPVWKGYLYCGVSIAILTYKAAVASYAFTMIYDSAVLSETVLKGLIHYKLLVINPVAKKINPKPDMAFIVYGTLVIIEIKLPYNTGLIVIW